MSERIVAIGLKIPDNEAYTALTALQRLGIGAARLERSDIWRIDDDGDPATLIARVEANETIFNPNKHRLSVLDGVAPRSGEAWIETLAQPGEKADEVRAHLGGKPIEGVVRAQRYVGWRLFSSEGAAVGREVVAAAVDALLCNPAIERAIL